MSTPELEVIKDIPGYKVILKAVLKSQIQQLVEQLAAHTDEESVILTASVSDGTLSHLGSDSGKSFLVDHEDIKSQFLGFCLRKHHKKKQQEKERQEREEAMRNLPTTPSRQPGPRFSPRSPRFPSPRQQGVYPLALTRASPGGPVRSPGMRHEPYPRPMKRPLNFDQQGRGSSQPPRMPLSGQVIKIEAEDPDDTETTNTDSNVQPGESGPVSSQPSSPSQANTDTNLSASSLKAETSDKDDDAKSESSASTIPNEASELKLDSAPAEGLSLDSDLSSLIPAVENSGGDNQQPNTPQTSASAPQTPGSSSGLDPNVNVKVEAITESEMELEITGVELGPQRVQSGTTQESWGPNVSAGGAMGYSPQGAAGNQADMQQGYSHGVESVSGEGVGPAEEELYTPEELSTLSSRMHECEICKKMFLYKSKLVTHMRSHTGERPFKCGLCGQCFTQSGHMYKHMYTRHGLTKSDGS